MTNELDEQKIVAQLKDPIEAELGFRSLIGTYKERLYWHIRRIVLIHEDTDDVLQDVFVKVYKNIHSFKEESSLYTWIYRIATNEALSHKKRMQRKWEGMSQSVEEASAQDLKADPYFSGDDAQLALKLAIDSLPEKQMLVFNMKYFQQLKYDEMSSILNTSVGALKASYHHAVKKIEAFIKNEEYG